MAGLRAAEAPQQPPATYISKVFHQLIGTKRTFGETEKPYLGLSELSACENMTENDSIPRLADRKENGVDVIYNSCEKENVYGSGQFLCEGTPASNCYFQVDNERFHAIANNDQKSLEQLSKVANGPNDIRNTQDAFYKARPAEDSDDGEDSVEAGNFDLLRNANLLQVFSQLKADDVLQEHSRAAGSDEESDMTCELNYLEVGEPMAKDGSLQLPKYDPKRNYFKGYWRLYLHNEQLMSKIYQKAEDRDSLLRQILQIEQFYNN